MFAAENAAPKSESLPRAKIIRRRTVFDVSRNKGKRLSNRYLTLGYIPREAVKSGEIGSVAFLTPKRLGNATVRNKLRRRMREIYRRHVAQNDEPNYLIWIARPSAVELDFETLKQTMLGLKGKVRTEN